MQLVTTAVVNRSGDGSYKLTVTITNDGAGTEQNVLLTKVNLEAAVGMSEAPGSVKASIMVWLALRPTT